MNIGSLKEKEKGPNKIFVSELLNELNIESSMNKNIVEAKVMRELLYDVDFNNPKLIDTSDVLSLLPKDLYILEYQREFVAKTIARYLNRYISFEKSRKANIIAKKVRGKIFDDRISVSADLVIRNNTFNVVEIIKWKRGERKLTLNVGTQNYFGEDLELYALYHLGKKLYPNDEIVASFYHMKYKDQDHDLSTIYDSDKNIVSATRGSFLVDKLDKEIEKLLEKQSLFNTEECKSKKNNCYYCDLSKICSFKENIQVEMQEKKAEKEKAPSKFSATVDQDEVVNTLTGVCRVNAGAGTGKTTTISRRLTNLIKHGSAPQDILMITFSNMGAKEIREKVSYWLEKEGLDKNLAQQVSIHTFNSFGQFLIDSEYKTLGFEKEPKLITKIDSYKILIELLNTKKRIFIDLDFKNPLTNTKKTTGALAQLYKAINIIKAKNIESIDELMDEVKLTSYQDADNIMEIYDEYNDYLVEHNMLEFNDQIDLINVLFENNPSLKEYYAYEHIIIDEYQDTSPSQMSMITHLLKTKKIKSFMVVGDDSQAIYGFRYTDPSNIIDFHKKFKGLKDVFLIDNFRSTKQIVEVANDINNLNVKKVDKDLIAHKDGDEVEMFLASKRDAEIETIKKLVLKLKNEKNFDYSDIAIIARTKQELLDIQEVLSENNIPSIMHVPELVVKNSYFAAITALADFMDDPHGKRENLLPYVFAKYQFHNKGVEEARDIVKTEIAKLTAIYKNTVLAQPPEALVDVFFGLISELGDKDEVIKEFLDTLKEKGFENIHELSTHLNYMDLFSDDTSIMLNKDSFDAVTLITTHSSKGREYKGVIHTITKYQPLPGQKEEDRRLLYVGITRAMDVLYITATNNTRGVSNASPYIKEILKHTKVKCNYV